MPSCNSFVKLTFGYKELGRMQAACNLPTCKRWKTSTSSVSVFSWQQWTRITALAFTFILENKTNRILADQTVRKWWLTKKSNGCIERHNYNTLYSIKQVCLVLHIILSKTLFVFFLLSTYTIYRHKFTALFIFTYFRQLFGFIS